MCPVHSLLKREESRSPWMPRLLTRRRSSYETSCEEAIRLPHSLTWRVRLATEAAQVNEPPGTGPMSAGDFTGWRIQGAGGVIGL